MTAEEILKQQLELHSEKDPASEALIGKGHDPSVCIDNLKLKVPLIEAMKLYAEQERKEAFAQALKYYGRDNVNHEGEYECSDKDVDWAYTDFSTKNPLT